MQRDAERDRERENVRLKDEQTSCANRKRPETPETRSTLIGLSRRLRGVRTTNRAVLERVRSGRSSDGARDSIGSSRSWQFLVSLFPGNTWIHLGRFAFADPLYVRRREEPYASS